MSAGSTDAAGPSDAAGSTDVGERAATKGDRTRRRLLDAAAAELARNGLAGASIGAIAAAAGLRTGSVYFHFPSKDELIGEVLEVGLRETLAHLDEALATVPEHGDPAARLRAAVRAHATAVRDLNDYTRVVLAPIAVGDGAAAATFRLLRRSYLQRWTALVTEAQQAGVIAPEPEPRLVRDLLFGAVNAVSLAGRPPRETVAAIAALLGLARSEAATWPAST
ncbi:MAG TPA: TetR family transcriptional regulator [Pseudonocardia sp.]|nr:TetR family transcriptional regulator [Pseudonocardia sp.]